MQFFQIGRTKDRPPDDRPPVQKYMNKKGFSQATIIKMLKAEPHFEWATLSNESDRIIAYFHRRHGSQRLTLDEYKDAIADDKKEGDLVDCWLQPSRSNPSQKLLYLTLDKSRIEQTLKDKQPDYFKIVAYEKGLRQQEWWLFQGKIHTQKL